MYFKTLELFGFKSFAHRTVIQFEPGVTAVVGPNGCGKSNISDAIRWVLGEQSAKSLRGASMEDVIFNGSATKEPVNFAEVSLTLSNESRLLPVDYDEVTISRRLYRSGESEYLINKNAVRLRDISEMLMGTGIGTESYSIIEQGQMDRILAAKPDERREIFEEAAGITKFKSKKREALRKLEQTDQNLLRVNDIIQEVKRQIGSIERQAKKAESYKTEFEKMKTLELGVASREFLTFESRRLSKEEELDELRRKEEEYLSLQETAEERCRAARERAVSFDEDLKRADSEETQASADVRRDQDRVLLNRERLGELAERRGNLERQIETAARRMEEFRREHDRLTADFDAVSREEAEGRVFLAGVETDFAAIDSFIRGSLAEEETAKFRLAQLADRKIGLQNDLAKTSAEIASLGARLRRLRQDEDTVAQEEAALSRALESHSSAAAEAEAALARVTADKASKEAALAAALARSRAVAEELNDLSAEESAQSSRLDLLTGLRDRHEGFLGGVKALLEEKAAAGGGAAGMVGLLADLVKAETGYELAVEAALESYLQAVVFRSDEDVLRAADFLRPSGKGRALLVSLAFGADAAAPVPAGAFGGAEPVLAHLDVDPSVRGLLNKLLGSVYVAADPRRAFELSRSNPAAVFVTREGERFEGQTVMGGSLSAQADLSLVGREQRVRETAEALAAKETELQAARAEEAGLTEAVRALADHALAAQAAASELRGKERHTDENRRKLVSELETLRTEVAELTGRERTLLAAEETLNRDFYSLAEEDKRLGEAVLGLRTSVREKADEKEALLVRLTETRSRQSHCTARREKIEKDKAWALEALANEEAQGALHAREAEEAGLRKGSLERENADLEARIADLSRRRDELLLRADGIRRDRDAVTAELAALERERDEAATASREARDRAHQFELEQAQLRFEIDRLKERIFNAYQVDLLVQREAAAAEEALSAPADLDTEGAKAQIQALREKLARMGPVNLVAIEEFEELKSRYDFLNQQQTDLVQAKEDLQKAIQKINRTTRELFVETFEKVQKSFSEYYKLLFGGGSAEIFLLDENDVLESGIEIVARPPGKKLQSISLLSGGEKSLTAVALVFSLFKVKPSPFCVLDEIDAPLDESNVERFCNVLREFIAGSQFILITHNKRTMNLADALYGVTMEQTGISKIVSVKLSERAERRVPGKGEAAALVE